MMTAVAGHSNKEVMMTMVARMMRTMTQMSRMCLGSVSDIGTSLLASMLLRSVTDSEEEVTVLYLLPASLVGRKPAPGVRNSSH